MANSIVLIGILVIVVIAIVAYFLANSKVNPGGPVITSKATTSASTSQQATTSIGVGPSASVGSATTTTNATSYTVNLGTNSTFGSYLANSTGFTLYTYTGDTPNSGSSACTGGCTSVWPVFYTSSVRVPPSLQTSNFGTITRTDGSKQTTYKGLPLYFYVNDRKPGVVNGNNVGGFVVAKS